MKRQGFTKPMILKLAQTAPDGFVSHKFKLSHAMTRKKIRELVRKGLLVKTMENRDQAFYKTTERLSKGAIAR